MSAPGLSWNHSKSKKPTRSTFLWMFCKQNPFGEVRHCEKNYLKLETTWKSNTPRHLHVVWAKFALKIPCSTKFKTIKKAQPLSIKHVPQNSPILAMIAKTLHSVSPDRGREIDIHQPKHRLLMFALNTLRRTVRQLKSMEKVGWNQQASSQAPDTHLKSHSQAIATHTTCRTAAFGERPTICHQHMIFFRSKATKQGRHKD